MNAKPLIDCGALHTATATAYQSVRGHRGSQVYLDVATWIDALIAQQQAHMAMCARDRLGDAQVRLKQLMALRAALVEPGGASTGHVFD